MKAKKKNSKAINKNRKNKKLINNKNKDKFKEIFKKILKYIKEKKYIVMCIILVITAIIILCLSNKKEETNIDNVIDTINYKSIKTKRTNKKIYKKYELKNYQIRETKNSFNIDEYEGKILFIRSKNLNLNVFQYRKNTKNDMETDKPITMQIETIFDEIKNGLAKHAQMNYITPIKEELTGKTKYNFPIPISESIYIEKRAYSSSYVALNGDKYDINLYMDGDYLVCELVKFLNLDKKEKK